MNVTGKFTNHWRLPITWTLARRIITRSTQQYSHGVLFHRYSLLHAAQCQTLNCVLCMATLSFRPYAAPATRSWYRTAHTIWGGPWEVHLSQYLWNQLLGSFALCHNRQNRYGETSEFNPNGILQSQHRIDLRGLVPIQYSIRVANRDKQVNRSTAAFNVLSFTCELTWRSDKPDSPRRFGDMHISHLSDNWAR